MLRSFLAVRQVCRANCLLNRHFFTYVIIDPMGREDLPSFSSLFKKYRLRSEIRTLTEFGDLLAEEGYVYENSLFTRWQNGERIPRDRKLLLAIISIFARRGGVDRLDHINEILASVQQRDLTEYEKVYFEKYLALSKVKSSELREVNIPEKNAYPAGMSHISFIEVYVLLALWWIVDPIILGPGHKRMLGDFSSIYFLMAVWGGVWGIWISKKWGWFNGSIGTTILMFSLGLFAQAFGECVYAFYTFYLHVALPYPSLGDLGYFGSILFYMYGTLLLARTLRVHIKLQSVEHKLVAIIIPITLLVIGYFLFLQNYVFEWSRPIKVFLDFGYPFAQAFYISIALLTYYLSKDTRGGILKNKIVFLLIALCVQFLSDYNFLYQSSRGTWVTGGFGNFLYLTAFFLMTLALFQLNTALTQIRDGTQ